MRPGMRSGQRLGTVGLWCLVSGSLGDLSTNARTLTLAGTGPSRLRHVDGPFGDAASFGETGDALFRAEADLSGADFSDGLTADLAVRTTSDTPETALCCRGTGDDHLFALEVGNLGGTLTAYDAAQVAYALAFTFPVSIEGRWTWLRVSIDPATGTLRVDRDGSRLALSVTALADLPDVADIGPLQIGAEDSDAGESQFVGRIAEVHLRSVVDSDSSTAPCRLGPSRITRRQFYGVEAELAEHLQGESWSDGGAYHLLNVSVLDLGEHILDQADVVSMRVVEAGVETVLNQVGNVDDVAADDDSYAIDGGQIAISDIGDPGDQDPIEVVAMVRLATRGLDRGGHYYEPRVSAASPGERSTAFLDQLQSTGGGGRITIAAAGFDIPTDERTSNVFWTNRRVRVFMLSDGLPWAERSIEFVGRIDAQPDADSDTIDVRLVHEPSVLYRTPFERAVLDRATYPQVYQKDEGAVTWTLMGPGLLRVPVFCIDEVPNAGYYLYKLTSPPAGLGISRLRSAGSQTEQITTGFRNVNLAAGTFEWNKPPSAGPYVADCDGLGEPSDPQSDTDVEIALPFGDVADTYMTYREQKLALLRHYLKVPDAEIDDASFTATGLVIAGLRRLASPLDDANSMVDQLRRLGLETFTHTWFKLATEKWRWDYIDKGLASSWTIGDDDLVTGGTLIDRSQLAIRLIVAATAYYFDAVGALKVGQETSLDLDVERVYQIHTPWNGGRFGFTTKTDADTFLARFAEFKSRPLVFLELVVTAAYTGIEQLDVATVTLSDVAADLGDRWRVYRVQPQANGNIRLVLAPEVYYPDDPSIAGASREIGPPAKHFDLMLGSAGRNVTDGSEGDWVAVDDWEELHPGDFGYWPTNVEHKLLARIERTSGGADADVQGRLRDFTNSLTLASLAGVATGDSPTGDQGRLVETTSFSNIPTAPARLHFETKRENGATPKVMAATWWNRESAPGDLFEHFGKARIFGWGYKPGASLNPTALSATTFHAIEDPRFEGKVILVYIPPSLLPGARYRFSIYADAGDYAGDITIGLLSPYYMVSGYDFTSLAILQVTVPEGESGFFSTDEVPTPGFYMLARPHVADYGTAKLHSCSLYMDPPTL